MTKLNVALIGHQFMGSAHSNAWRQVGAFYDLPLEPHLAVVDGGGSESARLGRSVDFMGGGHRPP